MKPSEIALEAMTILIVDDSDVMRLMLENSLREWGFVTVHSVASGELALATLQHMDVDMVILDIMMPGMGGLACCRAIRELERHHEIPILIGTSATEISLRVKAFENGATDFINTPILPDELHARVRVHLQNRRYIRDITFYNHRMMQEMRSARELQASMLPQRVECLALQASHKLEIASYFEPSSEIGGDFWGMKALSAQEAALWMVDFSGHGVTAAINAFRLQAYMKEESPYAASPTEYLSDLNGKLLQLLPAGHFATMFYGVLDRQKNRLLYSCACTPYPLLIEGRTGEVRLLEGKGNLLGIAEHDYPAYEVPFNVGDTLVLYSDALTETPNAEGMPITEVELLALAAKYAQTSATQLRDALLVHFRRHAESRVTDDFTLCLCKRVG